jgi:tetrapyrrole methylase family protein/MazG family protein/ATP diphosphatase
VRDGETLAELVAVMRRLLAPDGCPWDREQTFETLKPYVVEEAYEVCEAIDAGIPEALREELGDLLLQIVFQAELARARGWFGPDDVVAAIAGKLVRRHPHVFADAKVSGADEVVQRWEEIKAKEKAGQGALDGVPKSLPALRAALRVSEKAQGVGFDWPDIEGSRAKIDEELREVDQAVGAGDAARIDEEIGDLLFAIVNLSRKLRVDPEEALRRTTRKFIGRFRRVEAALRERGKTPRESTLEEMDALWEEAKKKE